MNFKKIGMTLLSAAFTLSAMGLGAVPAMAESSAESAAEAAEAGTGADSEALRVGSLKGPTTMGLVNLMDKSDKGEAEGTYEFTMATQPDEIAAGVAQGNFDIALVPANMASILYNKTKGNVEVIDINTLGVLYCVTGDDAVKSVKDLAGKTVYSTGQGATPEYAMNYLLDKNGITDCTIEFKSEATEVAAQLASDPAGIAVLPQPFVTVAEAKNDKLHTAFSLTDAWNEVTDDDSQLLTGVTIVRKDYLESHEDAVRTFMEESKTSVEAAASDVEGTSKLIAQYGIIEKAPIAAKALPECNVTYIDGEDMKAALSGYLQVLSDANPESVGGKLPADDFYYIAE